MEALLGKLIEQLNSSVFVLLAILGAAFWAIHRIGVWSTTFKHRADKISKIEGLNDKVVKIGAIVELIYQNTLGANRPVAAMSPINLTPIGKEITANIKKDLFDE
jgi:hypothetical protein